MKLNLICALVTPFDKFGYIDYQVFDKLVKKAELTHDAFVLCGSTGEGESLSLKEKISLYKYVRTVTTKPLFYTISSGSTNKVLEEINSISDFKVDGFLINVPPYFKPTQKGILAHFKSISNKLQNTPFIIYNIKSRNGIEIESETLRTLILECPNLMGLKEASDNYELVKEIHDKYPTFPLYWGNDGTYLEGLKAGATGIISVLSVIFPNLFLSLQKSLISNYEDLFSNQMIKHLQSLTKDYPNPVGIKGMLEILGIKSMNLRLPLLKMDDSEYQVIKELIGFIKY